MSDDKTPLEGGQTGAAGVEEFKAITSQSDLDRVLGERLSRERAKFPDYEAMKTKAAAFDKGAEADKTALQLMTDRADVAEKLVGGFQQEKQVTKWADEIVKGSTIPANVLRGNTEDELKAHFEQLKAIATPVVTTKRTAVPPGKSDKDNTGASRAVAALRQFRASA